MQYLKSILIISIVLVNNALSQSNIVDLRMKNNQINLAVRNLPNNLDPIIAATGHEIVYFQAIYQTLIRAGENGDLNPSLAKKWEFKKNGSEIVFHLDNAHFHNGEKVISDDAIYSLSRHLWQDSKSLDRDVLRGIIEGGESVQSKKVPSGIIKLDDEKFLIKLKKPYPGFLSLLSMAGMSILSKKEILKGQYVGSGPFMKGKNENHLVHYSKFNLEKIPLKELNFISFQSEKGIRDLISKKNVDVIYLGMGNYSSEIVNAQGFKVYTMDSPTFLHLFVNSFKGILADERKRTVLKGLLQSFAKKSKLRSNNHIPLPYLIPKGLLPLSYYRREIFEQDRKIVTKLLQSNEIYEILYSENSFTETFMKELQSFLLDLGIKNKVRKLNHNEYIDELLNKKKWRFDIWRVWSRLPGH